MLTWKRVVDALLTNLQSERDSLAAVMTMAIDEATHTETRLENKYDTRGLEASYLAAGQGQRLLEIDRLRSWVDSLTPLPQQRPGLGSLVHLAQNNKERHLFIAPSGGNTLKIGNFKVAIVSPKSPIGKLLMACEENDYLVFVGEEWEVSLVSPTS